jgi:hypothetical protein
MDPTANLGEQIKLAEKMLSPNEDGIISEDAAWRLAELVLSLNDWLSKGGFLPSQWEKKK